MWQYNSYSVYVCLFNEHSEKNEQISLPETHRNYSENLNAFLTHNSLDRKHLKERRRQKNAMLNLTSSYKSEKGVAKPIVVPTVPTSLSSYNTIINSHEGRSLLIDYCIEKYEIEKIYFISDIDGLKDYDTEELDWLVLVRKLYKLYIAPECKPDLLINLPKDITDEIRGKIKAKNCPMGIFDRAREFVLNQVDKNVVKHFLKSSEGSQYLKALVSFDNISRQVIRTISKNVNRLEIELNVIGYDKRHDTKKPTGKSKYYVYEIEVRIGEYLFTVFRAYKEFYNLHENLKKEFPKHLPPFPHKIYLRRSEVKSIARQRASDLNQYLQEILKKQPEISKHQELLTFIKQTETDAKDEEFNKFLILRGVRRANKF
ncbi:hypothetical protein LOD99_7313 [Oopsacas minuta]|uniref:PX domain-containing protein n=1 Tax=Oopsacas minuta TaxID=111878 RepID=A0AAV7JUB4_9METZ|nr:hypothetical protein LOD99_7313 [Oopsacas minuta]